MTDYRRLESQFAEHLRLTRRPVAVTFLDALPVGVARFTGTAPSGCSFWRYAAEGRTFYTVPSDHYNCPIGAYTHNIPLASERASELMDTLGFMASIGYVKMEEVPGIPQLPRTPAAIVYAPLGDAPVPPDVVLFTGAAASIMRLQEAAVRGGLSAPLQVFGRPTCMALPAALGMGITASTGCVGNRVYTGIDEGELYVAVPAKDLARLAEEAQTIASANAQLLAYHQDRRERLATV